MNERYLQLRAQVDELLQWKEDNERVQIPLTSYGQNSIDIMQKNHLVVRETFTSTGSDSASLQVINGTELFYVPVVLN